jgi:hypothetical protein
MRKGISPQRSTRSRLVAPVMLVLFALGWYQFSVVYIQAADNQLVASGNLAVYVTVQQIHGYLTALLYATYATVVLGTIAFLYNLARTLRRRS